MKLLVMMAISFFISQFAFAKECFNNTFCSTGKARTYIICGRGQDCTKSTDTGLEFTSDCTVKWWLGDAQASGRYSIGKNSIVKLPQEALNTKSKTDFKLSKDGLTLTAVDDSTNVYAVKSCHKPVKN